MTQHHHLNLFSMFAIPTLDEWWAIVRRELESDDPLSRLTWNTREGIAVKPLYTTDEAAAHPYLAAFPGDAPFTRGTTPLGYHASPWRIRNQILWGGDIPETELLLAEESGRGEIELVLEARTNSIQPFRDLLDRIDGGNTPIVLNAGIVGPAYFSAAVSHAMRNGRVFSGGVVYDPLSSLAKHGTLPGGISNALRIAADCAQFARERAPGTRTLTAGGHVFHNAGATSTQELAYTLAAGIEYVRSLASHGLSVDEACAAMEFSFSIGANFAFEVAKCRAARMLWAKIVHHFSPADAASKKIRLHARTSRWMQTAYDPHVNILRATIATMAAAIGGAEAITTLPFDAVLDAQSELSRRLARNTSVLLSEECGIARVIDPAGGSMYFDALADDVARAAWVLLQGVEAQGGFLRALESGAMQAAIQSTARVRDEHIAQRREVFIGTNQYPNLGEKSRQRENTSVATTAPEDATCVPVAPEGGNTMRAMAEAFEAGADIQGVLVPAIETGLRVVPMRASRGAEAFERVRAAVERLARRPKVLLVPLGPVAWRRARATFVSGFLGVAGFDIVDHPGYESVEEAVAAAVQEKADVVVVCSDDASYSVIAAEFASKLKTLKNDTLVLVAGYPNDAVDALRAAGVDDFIHLRTHALPMLESLLFRLGIDTKEVAR